MYRYRDDIFSVNNPDFSKYVNTIYHREQIINKANVYNRSCPFLDLNVLFHKVKSELRYITRKTIAHSQF